MRFRMIRFDTDRFAPRSDRLIKRALFAQRDAKVMIRFVKVGFDPDRFVPRGDRRVAAALLIER